MHCQVCTFRAPVFLRHSLLTLELEQQGGGTHLVIGPGREKDVFTEL